MGGSAAIDAGGWLIAIVLVCLVLAAAAVAIRRALIERGGGTVECGLRRPGEDPWRLGVASYQPDELRWHQVFGLLLRPDEILPRRALTVVSRRSPDADETNSLGPGMVVVECRAGERADAMELAMSESALTGFLAWLEAAPPASHPG